VSDQDVAVVVGGGSGLGAAAVASLHEAGHRVLVVDRDLDAAKSVAHGLNGGGDAAAADVGSEDEIESAFARAAELGRVTVSVNCAGVGLASRILDKQGRPTPSKSFALALRVNLTGTFNVLRAAAACMAANDPREDGERGVIVNTASIAAFDGQIGQLAYAASKGGVVSMTLPAARDLGPLGIRVVTIAPGTFDTPMMSTLPEQAREALSKSTPFPSRLGRPEEFGRLVLSIAQNPMLNGEVIRLDGAVRMASR
jgi:NAD(P)-dependent dehydrogenase (short-subunit alcohol dehydrogenase family)